MLSLCVITFNEADNIGCCLKSTFGLVDEMVVVDSGSSDGTGAIAESLGAKVLLHPWEGYVKQRNFALAQCAHEWILVLDADEELSPELHKELLVLKSQLNEYARQNVTAFAMSRRVYYRGRWIRHGDWVPDYVPRLFMKSASHYNGGLVHESLRTTGATQRLKHLIFHYTYRDRADHLARIEKYSSLWAQSQHANGKKVSATTPVGRALVRFVRAAFVKRGILEGKLGLDIAWLAAYEVWLKYTKLRSMQTSGRK